MMREIEREGERVRKEKGRERERGDITREGGEVGRRVYTGGMRKGVKTTGKRNLKKKVKGKGKTRRG